MEALTFRDFTFAYPGADEPVLRGVDWTVREGAFVLLVGATGSGKSTLLRSAKPEIAPVGTRTGSVSAFGQALFAEGAVEGTVCGRGKNDGLGLLVGFVSQSPESQIVCDTVWHELAFGLENLGTPVGAMRRRVAEVAHFFGIEPWFGQETARLSGGQKQLLNLASALVLQPRILLLDEPTAQLDPVAAKNFLHALFRVNRECGITVVVATHAPESVAAYATEAVCMREGRVEALEVSRFRRHPESGLQQEDGSESDHAPAFARAESAPAIDVREVGFRFGREEPWVLTSASLSVACGSVHAVVGGNGSGKSTLLRLVAGTLPPERGRVRNALRASQALVPQDPRALFACDSVREELMEWSVPAGYGEAEAEAMAKRFGLDGLGGRHPSDLSGGQQQLLAEAKALLVRPRLLLLDEPTKGLDTAAKLAVAASLDEERRRGTTILLVSHDLSFVSCMADAVTMLFDGEDACTEPADAFFAGNLFFRPEPDEFMRRWRKGDGR